ncbi:thioredoxin domain-containing protein [Streptomyces sp. TP-A0874]|uniref:thioredoxin domain-containing protein n=1 Tax=Streptomyces sp. TP-A0874 TaxID=549819 RepID=UPI000853623A|nr:thioredoxin domain-containing protein [Streptomyces sp. TP-A0874]
MSKRNSQDAKRAARERLRAERERQAKRDKVRRQLLVGGSVVAVLAIAAGIGVAVTKMNSGSDTMVSNADWKAAAKKTKFAKPANTSGAKGTTVVIGEEGAENTLEVFEDMRCPICATFEQNVGENLTKGMDDGTYKVKFTMGTFLDEIDQIKGSGSHNALSALGAALDVSPDAFVQYKKALFSPENHPEENDDAFSSDAKLIEIAQQVKELKGNKDFEKAVENGTFDKWALEMSAAFDKDKSVTGTPTLKLNGDKLTDEGGQNAPMSPEQFDAAVKKALSDKGKAQDAKK